MVNFGGRLEINLCIITSPKFSLAPQCHLILKIYRYFWHCQTSFLLFSPNSKGVVCYIFLRLLTVGTLAVLAPPTCLPWHHLRNSFIVTSRLKNELKILTNNPGINQMVYCPASLRIYNGQIFQRRLYPNGLTLNLISKDGQGDPKPASVGER